MISKNYPSKNQLIGHSMRAPIEMVTRSLCLVEGCNNTSVTRGWCHLHYKRWWKHGDPIGKRKLNDGRRKHPLYEIWKDMIRRCTNQNRNRDNFGCYAGRGINVCPRWRENFWNFVADMGDRPNNHSIERIANSGNYEPGNCRWATRAEQARNRRTNRSLSVNGQAKILTDWAKEKGIDRRTIANRLKWGWSEHDAVMTPIRPHRPYRY